MRDLTVRLADKPERMRVQLREWLATNAPPPPGDDDRTTVAYRRSWHDRLYAAGWSGIGWPERFGGRSASAIARYVYYEELARAGVPRLLTTPGIALVGPTLMAYGTSEQQARDLPRIRSGADIWCLGLSEPDAGSDLAALTTAAHRAADGWVVRGRKSWVRWAAYSSHCAVLVRTGEGPRHRGLSFLVVHLDAPGVTVRPMHSIDGEHTHDIVDFDDVTVPAGALIGSAGSGWNIAMGLMELERADQSFANHAELLELLRRALAEASVRNLAGALDDAQLAHFRRQAVAVWTECQLFRAVNLRTARRLDQGEPIGVDGSTIKLFWTQLYQHLAEVVDDALGDDLLAVGAASRRYLDARATSIFSGTSDIQRNVIGERIAQLPRPQRLERTS